MSNTFHLDGAWHCELPSLKSIAGRRGKLDVVTAAMLSGGASSGWGMTSALSSRAARETQYAQATRQNLRAAGGR